MAKKIFVRLGVSDIVLTKEENENFNGYLTVVDENGKELASPEAYLIGYEDEDGNECEQDGSPL